MMHLSLKSFAVIFSVLVSIAECQLYEKCCHFPGCCLQPVWTCPWLSHGTNISSNWAKSSQGKGYLLVGDVSSWRFFLSSIRIFFFVKRQKIEIVPQFDFFINVLANAMCYYTRRSSLTWLVLHTEGKICSVMWCAVQYSQHSTSITVSSSICFILQPFCNTDMTYSGEIFHVLLF